MQSGTRMFYTAAEAAAEFAEAAAVTLSQAASLVPLMKAGGLVHTTKLGLVAAVGPGTQPTVDLAGTGPGDLNVEVLDLEIWLEELPASVGTQLRMLDLRLVLELFILSTEDKKDRRISEFQACSRC